MLFIWSSTKYCCFTYLDNTCWNISYHSQGRKIWHLRYNYKLLNLCPRYVIHKSPRGERAIANITIPLPVVRIQKYNSVYGHSTTIFMVTLHDSSDRVKLKVYRWNRVLSTPLSAFNIFITAEIEGMWCLTQKNSSLSDRFKRFSYSEWLRYVTYWANPSPLTEHSSSLSATHATPTNCYR